MAGFQNNRGMAPARNAAASTAATGTKKAIFRTGLFSPNKEGVKSIGSVQLKEDVTLPAGSYINLYENTDRKSDTSPAFTVSVTEGKLKSASSGRK